MHDVSAKPQGHKLWLSGVTLTRPDWSNQPLFLSQTLLQDDL